MKNILSLMRIKHYIKNTLIFLPLFFSGSFTNVDLVIINVLGFISFCLLTSSIYIFNDICDIEKDKLHSTKCNRPVASGKVSKAKAIVLMLVCLALAVLLSAKNVLALIIMSTYAMLNILYSLKLKNVPIIDVAIIVAGFVLRLVYGGIISNIAISNWLYLVVIAISFYMGYGKRRNEILMQKEETRDVLKNYSYEFLDKNMYLSAALAIVFYTLWCVENTAKYTINLVFTVPLVMIIIMKYSLDIERKSDGDPVNVILNDKWLIGLTAIYGILLTFVVYY
ncbi:MAG: prenyltransferase [Clostridiales bacterium]|nr:prenyltransferase [Clostridiales bacterium]